jgi:molybdate transport repressor ModE-like protein
MMAPSWDDLRYLLAITRAGSAAGAAVALGVSHATVLRRLQALEDSFGVKLVERQPGGYAVTDHGDSLAALAESIEASLTTAHRR